MYGTKLENRTDVDNRVIEQTLAKLSQPEARGVIVQSGGLFYEKSPAKWKWDAPCHGWVADSFRAGGKITHVVTSLYYYKIYNDGKPVGDTKRMISKWYEDLFNVSSFQSIRDNCLILDERKGMREGTVERYAIIRVTPENIGNLGTFLIMSRHAYEEATQYELNKDGSLLTHNMWYHLCYKRDFPFGKILPFCSTTTFSKGTLRINDYPHGHSAIDGIPTKYPLIPNEGRGDKFGFSRSQYTFLSKGDLTKALNKVLGKDSGKVKHVFGYLLPESAYKVYNNIKEEDRQSGSVELPSTDFDKIGKILCDLHDELYNSKG